MVFVCVSCQNLSNVSNSGMRQVYDYITSKRGKLKLNLGFQMALLEFEKGLLGTQSDVFMSKDRSKRRENRSKA